MLWKAHQAEKFIQQIYANSKSTPSKKEYLDKETSFVALISDEFSEHGLKMKLKTLPETIN